MESDDVMRLFVWGTGWGLPSIDPVSLQLIAYVKFSGAPVTILECENPWKSPKGILPFFKHGTTVLYSLSELEAFLRQKNYSCDFGLTRKQGAEVVAYTQFVTESLSPALNYFCWVYESNYGSVVRPCYTKRLPWFYKLWYTDQHHRSDALKQLHSLREFPETDTALVEPDVLQKAQHCITALSDKLGNQEFFVYPNSPSALDAVIFSYLASFIKIPLPHSPLKDAIKLTPNLENFIARVLQRYHSKFKDVKRGVTSSASSFGLDGHPVPINTKFDEANYPMYQKVMAITVGASIMLAFAYHNGMVNFGFLESSSSVDQAGGDDDENLIWE